MSNFPQGADYGAVQSKLHADKKYEWASWLTNAAWAVAFNTPAEMSALTKSEVDTTIADTKDSPNSATGYGTIAFVAGCSGMAKAGEMGCFALCYFDGKRNRTLVGYVGEDGIKADTFYRVQDGKLVAAE